MAEEKKEQAGALKAVSTLQPGERSEALYDEWAKDYDRDLTGDYRYRSPDIVADAVEALGIPKDAALVDLGCGTGLIGAALKARGYATLDGLDVSQGMLDQAAGKGIYRQLFRGDLTAKTPLADASYDHVLCIGSMGAGHVDADHLPELLRPLKPGGYLVLYMNAGWYEELDFGGRFEAHEEAGRWRILKTERSNYMEALDRPGYLIVGQKPA